MRRIAVFSFLSVTAVAGWTSIAPAAQATPAAAARGQGAAGAGQFVSGLHGLGFSGPLKGLRKNRADGALGGRMGGPGSPHGMVPGARSATVIGTSPGYAGYQVTSASASPVGVSFVVPSLACPSNRDLAVIPGVIAGGSHYLGAGIALNCSGGQASYSAVSFFDGPFDSLNIPVSAGDSVSFNVSVSNSSAQATVTDITTGQIGQNTYPGFTMGYADIGDDYEYNYYTPLGIAPFGSIAFTSASVGGQNLGSLSPFGYNMSNGTTALIRTSAINSAGTGFITTFLRSLFPTTVQGRVVEGLAGHQTLSATVWPATFTSTASSLPSSFSATIYWGDGTSPTTGSISTVASWNCTYSPLAPVGTCFAVTGRHLYRTAGDYVVTVAVAGPGGGSSASGVAEIVNSTPAAPATQSIGVLTWTTSSGSVEECTATALAALDMVVTGKHCFDSPPSLDSNFEFAPQHSGNCGSGTSILSISDCEAAGQGTDPFGYWTGIGAIYPASDTNASDAGHDTTVIPLEDISSTGYSLIGDIGGLPLHFDPPHGQLTFNAYGYPGRVGNWNLQKCLGAPDVSDSSDTVIGITPCSFGPAGGASGGPFISSHFLPDAISATLWGFCPPNSYCHPLQWAHPEPNPTAVGNLMSNNSMQVYLAAVVGVPQP